MWLTKSWDLPSNKSHGWRRADPLEPRGGGAEQPSPDTTRVTGRGLPGFTAHPHAPPPHRAAEHARKTHAALRLPSRRSGHHILELPLSRARFHPPPGTCSEVQRSKARKGSRRLLASIRVLTEGWPHTSPTELGREPMPGARLGLASLSRSLTEGKGIC